MSRHFFATPSAQDEQVFRDQLFAKAVAARPALLEHKVLGDGNCLFRAVAYQTPEGEGSYPRLRAAAVQEVQEHLDFFGDFFDEDFQLQPWLDEVSRDRGWGDNFALLALCNVLGRPAVIWRSASPKQPPTLLMPRALAEGDPEPLYLNMDEEFRGCEHYDPLVPPSKAPAKPELPELSPKLEFAVKDGKVFVESLEQMTASLAEDRQSGDYVPVAAAAVVEPRRDNEGKEKEIFWADERGRVFFGVPAMHADPPLARRRLRGKQPDEQPPLGSSLSPARTVQKKGADKIRKDHRCCIGFTNASGVWFPCKFSAHQPGAAARQRPEKRCVFCSETNMLRSLATAKGRAALTKALRVFRSVYDANPCVYNAALLRIPDEKLQDEFHKKVTKDVAKKSVSVQQSWDRLLQDHRKRAFRDLGSKASEQVAKRVKTDRKKVQQKFFEVNHLTAPQEVDDIAPNDCGLPAAALSGRAAAVESWCKLGSWGICDKCHSLQARWGMVRSQNFREAQA